MNRLGYSVRSGQLGRASRLGTCAIVLGALLFSTRAAAAATPVSVRVSISLSARASSKSHPVRVFSTVSVLAPLSDDQATPAVRRLRASSRESSTYRHALVDLLTVGGTLSRGDVEPFVDPSFGPGRRLRLLIAEGFETVTVTVDDIAGWRGASDGRTVELQPHSVAANAQLDVSLRVDGSRAATAQPLPTTQRSDHQLSWRFLGGETPRVRVGFDPELFDDGVGDPRIISTDVVDFLVLGLPFAALFALGIGPWRVARRSVETDDVPERALRRLSVAGVTLALAGSVSVEFVDNGVLGLRRLAVAVFGAPDVGIAAISLLGLLAFVALAGSRRRNRRWPLIVVVCVALLVALRHGLGVPPAGSSSERALWPYAAASAVLMTTVIAASVGALGRWSASVAPQLAEWWCDRITPRWRHAIIAATALAATLQLLGGSAVLGPASSATALMRTLAGVPLSLVNLLSLALATILGVGLTCSLGRRAVFAREFPIDDGAARKTLALLFTMTVIRRGGTINGYAVPVAFGIGLLALIGALGALGRHRRARLIGDPAVRAEAPDLLARAERMVLLMRRRDLPPTTWRLAE